MQLQDLLTLSSCLTGYFNHFFIAYFCNKNSACVLLSSSDVRFDYCKPWKHQLKFFHPVGAPAIKLTTTLDITNSTGWKQLSLRLLWSFFKGQYKELISATLRLWEYRRPAFDDLTIKGDDPRVSWFWPNPKYYFYYHFYCPGFLWEFSAITIIQWIVEALDVFPIRTKNSLKSSSVFSRWCNSV